MAPLASHLVRALGCVAERPQHHIRLRRDGGQDDEPERPRKGRTFKVPIAKFAFSTVVSAPRQYAGHSGSLEAHGVASGLNWVLR